jgi:hypothetical protein
MISISLLFILIKRNIKFLKWWIQSFLIDIKRIIVGLRDDDGIVTKVIECNTHEILKSAQVEFLNRIS